MQDVVLVSVGDGLGATCGANLQLEWLEVGRDLLLDKVKGNFA